MLRSFYILRIFLFPFLRYIAPIFSKKVRERIEFEFKNRLYIPKLEKADYGFEVSSEGELEQIKVVLLKYLDNGDTVELIYCSPSVESQCIDLLSRYPNQIRLYRYPILTYNPLSQIFNPNKWLTCKKLYLCRYDFFPELILYGKNKVKDFTLLSGTLINFDQKPSLLKAYLKVCYQSFTKIITVTDSDKNRFVEDFKISDEKIETFDFRVIQIINRIKNKDEKINEKLPGAEHLLSFIQNNENNLILGSFWQNEASLFEEKSFIDKYNIFIAPHKLDNLNIKLLKNDLENKNIIYYEINKDTTNEDVQKMISDFNGNRGVWILNLKGILCELYAYFKFAYVGGGFGESIHSVLEPFIAGALITCGPKNQRSTELKMIQEQYPQRVQIVDNPQIILSSQDSFDFKNIPDIDSFKRHYHGHLDLILQWLTKEFKV